MFLNQSLVNEPIKSVVPLRNASIQKKCNFASSFVSLLLKKRPVKILASFLVDSIAREHLAFLALALTPPRVFSISLGGGPDPLLCYLMTKISNHDSGRRTMLLGFMWVQWAPYTPHMSYLGEWDRLGRSDPLRRCRCNVHSKFRRNMTKNDENREIAEIMVRHCGASAWPGVRSDGPRPVHTSYEAGPRRSAMRKII